MYTTASFREDDPARLFDLVEKHSFGALIIQDEAGCLEISHLPFLLDRTAGPHGTLRCHVARPNRIWQLAAAGRPVTCVFTGPHAYVSARWYEQPAEQVPTWNYAVVHAHGRARAPLPAEELLAIVTELAAIHERGAETPWTPASTEPGFVESILGAIVGIEIPIERLEGKFKLSQNRSAADQARVRAALLARGDVADLEMVRWMKAPPGERPPS